MDRNSKIIFGCSSSSVFSTIYFIHIRKIVPSGWKLNWQWADTDWPDVSAWCLPSILSESTILSIPLLLPSYHSSEQRLKSGHETYRAEIEKLLIIKQMHIHSLHQITILTTPKLLNRHNVQILLHCDGLATRSWWTLTLSNLEIGTPMWPCQFKQWMFGWKNILR